MIATLIGGTGMTGSALLRKLLADPEITRVVAISRRSLALNNAKLTEVLISDLADLPSVAAKIRGELYFCCLGTTIRAAGSKQNFEKVDQIAVVEFAKISKAQNARSLTLVTAMGADARSLFFYNQVKGRTEDAVKAIGLRSLTILRPALLVGTRQEFRFVEMLATATLVPLAHVLPSRTRKRLITDVETLAGQMLTEGKAARAGVHVMQAVDI